MKRLILVRYAATTGAVILACIIAGCAQVEPSVQSKQLTAIVTQQNHKVFRCQPYLELAAGLQAMPPAEAASQLRAWADSGKYDKQVLILCRMLFVGKDGLPLSRSPYLPIGMILQSASNDYPYWTQYPRSSFGETQERDWLDWPLVIVDGVPFCIQAGPGVMAGPYPPLPLPLQSPGYLDYCLKEGQWTERRYAPVDLTARQKALDELLQSPKWNREVGGPELRYLTYQIADQANAIEPEVPPGGHRVQ